MGMRSTIKTAVNKAFTALGDLASEGTLQSVTSTGFDFGSGSTVSASDPVVIDVVIMEQAKTELGPSYKAIILKDGFTVQAGDLVTVDSVNYKVSNPVDNSFTIECDLTRGSL